MMDNVLTYKRSNARVSHRVIERVSKYKQESASISKGCSKVGETLNTKVHVPQSIITCPAFGDSRTSPLFLLEPLLSHNNTELFH